MSDTSDLEGLLRNLQVEEIDTCLFIGKSPSLPKRVFGGQVLAQAMNAAVRTVAEADRMPHSMHAYFLRPGDPGRKIVYEVDPIRNGRSFTTRRVVAKQNGRAIFSTSISFQVAENGPAHQFDMPAAPDPESLESDHVYWERLAKETGDNNMVRSHAIDRRSVNRRDMMNPAEDIRTPENQVWFKAAGELPDDPRLHQTLLAYMSDMTLIGVALNPHPYSTRMPNMQFASLDHAIWFHQPLRVDEWLLYQQDSPAAMAARGFCRGTFYTQDGRLVASTTQEALIRPI